MILILIALVAVTSLALAAIQVSDRHTLFNDFIGPGIVIAGLIGLLVYPVLVFHWVGAEHKMNIVNREYQTTYTQAEVFYAGSVIDTIRQLDRKRVELTVGEAE